MLKTRKRSISLLVALAFLLTLVLPMGAALAANYAVSFWVFGLQPPGENATVRLLGQAGQGETVIEAVYNDEGGYWLGVEAVPAGTYYYTVEDSTGNAVAHDTVTVTSSGATANVVVDYNSLYDIAFTVQDAGGALVDGAEITLEWNGIRAGFDTTDDNGAATIQAEPGTYTYRVTALGYGIATGSVTVTNADVSRTVTLSPAPQVVALRVTLDRSTLAAGEQTQARAVAMFRDLTTQDVTTEARWVSSDTSVATVTSQGLVTAVGVGTTTITAQYTDAYDTTVRDSATVTVAPRITVEPDTVVEGEEDGAELTVTLAGDTFDRGNVNRDNVLLFGAPAGVSIGWVEYVDTDTIRVVLSGAAADYDQDKTATLTVKSAALAQYTKDIITTLTFKAIAEAPPAVTDLDKYRNGFSSSYSYVLTGKDAKAGFAAIRLPEDPDVPRYADEVVVNVTLPDGVKYMAKASADSLGDYVKVYIRDGEITPALVSSSRSGLEISVSGLAQPLELAVVFSFREEGKSALEIDSDYTGDIKATVEYVGFDGDTTVFSGSEDLLIARVSEAEVTVSAASPKTVAIGSNREAAKITIAEGTAGTLKDATITLEIVTDGASFSTESKVSGIRYNIPSSNVTIDDEILEIEMPSTQTVGLPGKVEITPYLDLTPDAGDEVEIQVTVTKGDKELADETVTVAKVAAAVSYTVTDVKNTGGSIVAGHDASILKEEGDAAEFTIETVGSATFPSDALIYVELSGAKFDSSKPFKVDGSYAGVKTYNDNKAAWFAPPDDDDEVTLSDFQVKADGEAAAGDITVKLSSNLGTFDPAEVVIGKVVKPFEVTASAAPAIAYLGRAQAAGDIVIKETKKGALDQAIQLELPEGVSFASKPTVKVTDGNLDLGSTSLEDRGRILVIGVDGASTRPSTVTISGIKYDVSRLALDGDVEVKIVGAEDTRSGWEDKTIATMVNAKVVSAAKREASFVIGSTTYTVNGEEYTMDVAPYIDAATGRTYVPVRYVAYALGVAEENIFWDAQARTVTLLKGDRVVQMTIGSKAMFINGASLAMDAAPVIKDGRTMLPFRWAAQALGASVSWDEATKTVTMKIE